MKFTQAINEIVEVDTTDIPSILKERLVTFVVFDTETTGLFGDDPSDDSKLPLANSRKIKDEIYKYYIDQGKSAEEAKAERDKFRFMDADLQLTEIAAIAITFENGKPKGQPKKFHEYVKFNQDKTTPFITKLIQWSEKKEEIAKEQKSVIVDFNKWLKKFPNKVLIAHNLKKFDLPIVKTLSKQYGVSLDDSFTNTDRMIDTIDTVKLRKVIGLPTGTNKHGKRYDINNQEALLKQFKLVNSKAHTAISDVKYLMKLLKKMLTEYTVGKSKLVVK